VSDIARTQGELNGDAQSGTGSDIQRAIQAATAAAQGLAGGDMTAALAGAAAPYVAEIIGHRSGLDDDGKSRRPRGGQCRTGGSAGERRACGCRGCRRRRAGGTLALEMYGKDVAALSESEKQTISAWRPSPQASRAG
jgi:filamentous hemagglutinin